MTPRNLSTALFTLLAVLPLTGTPAAASGNSGPHPAPGAEGEPFSVDLEDFADRKLAWSYFRALAEREDVMIIDVRSGFLPATEPPGLAKVRPVPLEIFLRNFVDRRVHQDRTLLIFDQSGEDLRRLQFHLQQNGYENYFFLEGGAESTLSPRTDRS